MLLRICIGFSLLSGFVQPIKFKSDSKLKLKEFTKLQEGDKCDRLDFSNFPVEGDITEYLYCHWWSGRLTKSRCPVVGKIQKVFDKNAEQCLYPDTFLQHAAGSAKVGDTCIYNTDCLSGAYCSNGVCSCLSTYVERETYCYLKIGPSQSGCQYDEQCSASWPQATCNAVGGTTSATGICQCPPNTVAIETRDGYLCSSSTNAACPLPVAFGANPNPDVTLKYDGTGDMAKCTYGSTQAGAGQDCNSAATNGYSLGELFECMPAGTQLTAAGSALCCPNRAFTCIQPSLSDTPNAANSAETIARWWYNAVTGTCEQFLWVSPTSASTTRAANSNNFETLAHCQTYCGNTCPRGNSEYGTTTNANTLQSSKPLTCTSISANCDSNHECTTIGSFQTCCSTYTYICSQEGGVTQPSTITSQFNPGISPATPSPVQRWYYDALTSRCASFSYNGVAGNFNNFATQEDCRSYCRELLCTRGNPIADASGAYQTCNGNSGCPSTYLCNNNVCCPTAQTVCAEPKQIGTCNQNVRRYWYNSVTRECEQFYYSGCQGNDNNFEDLTECNTYCRNTQPQPKCIQGDAYKDSNGNYYQCSNSGIGNRCPANYECYYDGFVNGCCPLKAYTCALQSSQGVQCGVATSRWYYDSTNQACQTFNYLGCDGNSNNFPNRELCDSYCGTGGCPFGGDPFRELDNSIRICSVGVSCPSTHECQRVTLSSSSRISYCCPSRAYICSLPPAASQICGRSSGSALTRYYHNIASRDCVQFQYYGCSSNENNYATLAQCKNFCDSSGCQLGEAAYINQNTLKPETCNPSIQSSCPNGYTCRFNTLTGANICCGATDMGVCPTGEKAFVDPYNLQARECAPNIAGTCPTNYLCRFRTQNSKYYCCMSTTLCPAGKEVYRDPETDQAGICVLRNVINSCPTDYSCQNAAGGSAFQGYCCTVENSCPNNGIFSQDQNRAGIARLCALGSTNTCPPSFQCAPPARNTTGVVAGTFGYCCTPGTPNVCGNASPYLINSQPVSCDSAQPTACPQGYACQTYAITGQSFCCSTANCPTGSSPFLETNGQPRSCSPGSLSTCPSSYSCVLGLNGQFQCCSSSLSSNDGCPSTLVAYLEPGTNQPRSCSLQSNSCPTGYNCQFSSSLNRFQCCGTNAECPINTAAYINPNTGGPQSCSQRAGVCPTGYSCQIGLNGAQQCCTGGSLLAITPVLNPACGFNQVLYNGQCLQIVGVGQPCSVSAQCSGSSNCVGNICQNPGIGGGIASCPIPGQSVQSGYENSGISCTQNSCSLGYNCQYSPNAGRSICCGSPVGSNGQVCPVGSNVAINQFSNTPMVCTGQGASCGVGYECVYSQVLRQYYCCSTTSIGSGNFFGDSYRGCNSGSEYHYPATRQPLQCTYLKGNCPSGYFCSYSTLYNTDICCSGYKKMKGKKPSASINSTEENGGSSTNYLGKDPNNPFPRQGPNGNSIHKPQPNVTSGQCDPMQRKDLGEVCCSDTQCAHHCSQYRGTKMCMCPRHLLIDMTYTKAKRCVSSCPKWRDGAFCVSTPPHKQEQPFSSSDFGSNGQSGLQNLGHNYHAQHNHQQNNQNEQSSNLNQSS